MRTAENQPRDHGVWPDAGDAELQDARYDLYLAERDFEAAVGYEARRRSAVRLKVAEERLALILQSR